MKTIRRWGTLLLVVGMLVVSAACVSLGSMDETALAPVSFDQDTLVALVEAEVATQLEAQSEPAATSDPDMEITPAVYTQPVAIKTDLEAALVDVYARANPAVVYIIVGSGSGSGFVYSDEGYIVTNNHVVAGGATYEIVFCNGDRQYAALVGTDLDSDLAVLKVETLPVGITALPLAEAGDLSVGELVVAIGNPFGEQGSMSLGIVSGLGRSLMSQRSAVGGSAYSLPQVIQTDAPINPGNSGGPLLNLAGEVVGVNAAIATTTGANSGVGFSIPAAAVRRIVPDLIETGRYVYPYMGVSFDGELSLEDLRLYGLSQTQGAYVLNVTPGGPGAQAGLIAADRTTGYDGDLIIALDGAPVNHFGELNTYLSYHTQVGQT
ncbi:MAG: trypsin-like peptidase domain-containing protein, partial [Anaerolineae bacterium]|nr:trypsin-like peptidase domain-containing protein [Anaerolineae bacterium]